MMRYLVFSLLLLLPARELRAQPLRQLKGRTYEQLHLVRGFMHYQPVKAYRVFGDLTCYRYRDTVTYREIMVFEKNQRRNGREEHVVADVLPVDGTGRYRILSVGANRFSAYSEQNIIIAIEEVDTSGGYVLPPRSRTIYQAYTLEHKGHKFVPVPLEGLYRVGADYYRERATRY